MSYFFINKSNGFNILQIDKDGPNMVADCMKCSMKIIQIKIASLCA